MKTKEIDKLWKPAETAPKNGEHFIAYDPRAGLLFTMHYSDGEFLTECEQWSGTFTHWMPLPSAPND